ncbi:riboflavin kinase [Pseudoalteromonas lipolytica]|uniref:riboflavin kinase n=1 Tax=Pseudoalteromonas lipolytica TaxID=570156 RepID=UPI003A96FCEB
MSLVLERQIALKRHMPSNGVFAVKATVGNEQLFGVANIGNKPTFNGTRALLEVHLFNFAQDIYDNLCMWSL